MSINESSLEKLRSVMQQNPELMDLLTGKQNKNIGRPKGAKNQNTLVPGKQLEIVHEEPLEETPTPISMTAAKKMLKQYAKPRQYTEEHKAKMLENLAKGRAKRQESLAASKQVTKAPVVKKYIIKDKKTNNKRPKPEEDEISEEEVREEDPETEIYKRLEKKQKILAKLNELQKMAQPQKKRYSLFY